MKDLSCGRAPTKKKSAQSELMSSTKTVFLKPKQNVRFAGGDCTTHMVYLGYVNVFVHPTTPPPTFPELGPSDSHQ